MGVRNTQTHIHTNPHTLEITGVVSRRFEIFSWDRKKYVGIVDGKGQVLAA
jgi:hypothetical protein